MSNITFIHPEQPARLRTPYHDLGEAGTPRIPAWASRRSVYRSAGRTLYLVETDRLEAARRDLAALRRNGWEVQIDAGGGADRVALVSTPSDSQRAA